MRSWQKIIGSGTQHGYASYGGDATCRITYKWVDSGVNADYADSTLASLTNKNNNVVIGLIIIGL